jgi:hypothetical protein
MGRVYGRHRCAGTSLPHCSTRRSCFSTMISSETTPLVNHGICRSTPDTASQQTTSEDDDTVGRIVELSGYPGCKKIQKFRPQKLADICIND